MCCNFGCWHCAQVEIAAAVVFHWLRRERVLERDIFRLGTGTSLLPNFSSGLKRLLRRGENYRLSRSDSEIRLLLDPISSRQTRLIIPLAPTTEHQSGRGYGLREVPATSRHIEGIALRNSRHTMD